MRRTTSRPDPHAFSEQGSLADLVEAGLAGETASGPVRKHQPREPDYPRLHNRQGGPGTKLLWLRSIPFTKTDTPSPLLAGSAAES